MIDLFGRLIRYVVRLIGGPTLLRLVLLCVTLVSVGRGLIAVVGHIQPAWLPSTIVYAALIGWLLGRSRLPGWGSVLAALGIGLFWLVLSVGQMSGPVNFLLKAFPPILKSILFRSPPEVEPLLSGWTVFTRSWAGLHARIILWGRNAGTSTLIIDPGVTSLVWGLALWLVSAWAAWWIRRREALAIGLVPSTVLLIYNVYYTNSRSGIYWLVLTGGGWIVLQALESFMKARRRWQEKRMGQTEIEPLLVMAIIIIAAGLMLAGGLLPSVSIQKISDSLQQIFHSQPDNALAKSLGLQQTPIAVPQAGINGIGLSDTHTIGAGPQLSQQVLMYVSVEGYVPPPPAEVLLHTTLPQTELRYYWRSQTFDTYNGHVWIANTAITQEIAANRPYHPDLTTLPANYQVVRQRVERLQSMTGALFVTGDLLNTDQLSVAAWRTSGDLIDARTNADSFAAESRIQSVSVEQLRFAGNNYPDTVRHYLDLPDELPSRVRDLAVRLTIDQPTPYDQVMAIQNYLRQFPYSLDVPGAPVGRDVADYFLFDLQKGYCDYFATTMAVMVRVAGIPARIVTGFSSGAYDYASQRFIVVEANAHTWVEVYFPGIGWVEFEPTTNQPPIHRPGETASQSNPAMGIPLPIPVRGSGGAPINWRVLRQPLLILELVLVGLLILLILWLFSPLENWWLALRPAEQAITTIQRRLYRQGRAWGVTANAARTPHEFAGALSHRLERYAGDKRLASTVAALHSDVNGLTELYVRLLFSPHALTRAEHLQAIQNWARIRKGLRRIRNS
jgi:transglutaminase-like putative cysteine protease